MKTIMDAVNVMDDVNASAEAKVAALDMLDEARNQASKSAGSIFDADEVPLPRDDDDTYFESGMDAHFEALREENLVSQFAEWEAHREFAGFALSDALEHQIGSF